MDVGDKPSNAATNWVRGAGVVAGLALAIVALGAWRVPGGWADQGARLALTAHRTGPLEVNPTGKIFSAVNLHPGDPIASTRITVRNQTALTLAVRVRIGRGSRGLDRLVRVRIRTPNGALFDGRFQDLRDWTPSSLQLTSAQTTTLALQVWLPPTEHRRYQGRGVDASLEFMSTPSST